MALTDAQFRAALRVGDAPEEIEQATRIRGYVYIAIEQHSPNAPDAVKDEAAVRLGGYLYDQPHVGRAGTFANALRSSGAAHILLPHVQHRLGLTDTELVEEAASSGTPGNPVTSITIVGIQLIVVYQDGTVVELDLPSSIDSEARQAAANAQAAAAAADQRAAGNTTLIGNLNTNLQAVRNTHLQQHDVQAGSGIAVDLIEDVDNGPGVRIRNTQTPGEGGVTTEELETLLPTASQTQAEAPSGSSRLIWTVTRLRQLITAALPTVSNSDATAGTSAARRVWTALRVRQAINAVVPAVFRTGNTDRIAENKLPQDALLQEQVQSSDGTVVIDQLPNGAGVDLAVATAAEGRLGVLEFIRPGSDPTKVIGRLRRVQDFPASTNAALEMTPFYVGENGGYTLSVDSAFDFGGDAFTGGPGTMVVILEGADRVAPVASNEDMLLLRRGQLYRQDVHPGRNLAVGWREYVPSDAPAGQTYIAAVDSLNDVPRTASHTANQLYYIRQGGVWALTNGSGGFTEAPPDHWLGNKAYSHDADTAVNTHADETTPEGIGFVAAYATEQAPQLFPYVSNSYTAPAEESRVWVRIDDDLQARITALENEPSPGPSYTQLVSATSPDSASSAIAFTDGGSFRTAWNSGIYHSILFEMLWTNGVDVQATAIIPIRRLAETKNLRARFTFDDQSLLDSEAGYLNIPPSDNTAISTTANAIPANATVKLYGITG